MIEDTGEGRELAPEQAASSGAAKTQRVDPRSAVEVAVTALVAAYPELAGREAELTELAMSAVGSNPAPEQIASLAQSSADVVVSAYKGSLPPSPKLDTPEDLKALVDKALPVAFEAAEAEQGIPAGLRTTLPAPAMSAEEAAEAGTGPERFINQEAGRSRG